jgi:hypothetical protein
MPRPEVVHVLLYFADNTIGAAQIVVGEYNERTGAPHWTREFTPEVVASEIAKFSTPDPRTGNLAMPKEKLPIKGWRLCAPDEYPADRTYRDAWRDVNGKITHDMAHAREIHRTNLRRDRGPLLDALDVAYMRAIEPDPTFARKPVTAGAADDPVAIVARKQKLRDATKHPAIEAAQTVEELKALTLDRLTQ